MDEITPTLALIWLDFETSINIDTLLFVSRVALWSPETSQWRAQRENEKKKKKRPVGFELRMV